MISRLTLIKNVGRFVDCAPAGRSFGPQTVIYGNNGEGKSTLTSIFRSLKTNDPNLIKERKTFGTTAEQQVELVYSNGGENFTHCFRRGVWSRPMEGIEVFDTQFIAQNIFDGEILGDDQLANMHKVVIGSEGTKLAREIELADRQIRGKEQEIRRMNDEYSRSGFQQVLSVDRFLQSVKVSGIEKKIASLEQQESFSKLRDLPDLPHLQAIDTRSLHGALAKNLDSGHDLVRSKIEEHIEKHWSDKMYRKEFLGEGLKLLRQRDPHCPFCGQSLAPVEELIDAYKTFFNEEFRTWSEAVHKDIETFLQWNLESMLNVAEGVLKDWVPYLEDVKSFWDEFSSKKLLILREKEIFDDECRKKSKNLDYRVNFTSLEILEKSLGDLNKKIVPLNKAIEEYRLKIKKADVARELMYSRALWNRYTPRWRKFCEKLANLKHELQETKESKELLIAKLNEYSAEVFSNHQEDINKILDILGADFRIANFNERTDRRRVGTMYCDYQLVFFGRHRVQIRNQDGQPDFQNTLSHGDKNTLALAFFMAVLWQDENLGKKIILIDDPVSSFDRERKLATVELLANLGNRDNKRPLQLIIMTHDLAFLAHIYEHQSFTAAKYLKIVPDGTEENGCKRSNIRDCKVYEEYLLPRELGYLEKIREIVEANRGVSRDNLDMCRIVIENVFQRKYHLEIRDLGPKAGLKKYIDRLVELHIYDEPRQDKFKNLPWVQASHHSVLSPTFDSLSDGDIMAIFKKTLELMREI